MQRLKIGHKVASPFTTSCGQCFFCQCETTCRCLHAQVNCGCATAVTITVTIGSRSCVCRDSELRHVYQSTCGTLRRCLDATLCLAAAVKFTMVECHNAKLCLATAVKFIVMESRKCANASMHVLQSSQG